MNEFKTVGLLEPLHLFRPGPCAAESSGKSAVFVSSLYQQYLKPYQKDGIRFLYKQFYKNQPGVILNDGPGHGKSVQILLFLSAINVLLRQQPSLIICNSKNIDHWKYHICKWIEKGKDLIRGPDNVFAKKLYFVATLQDLESISRREWAVLVVDDIELSIFTKKCHLLRAKYKIWLSNDDLMSDLVSLNQIYHWLAPKEQTNLVSKFSTVGLDRKAVYLQTLDLHTFCDTLLLRRANETCLPLIDPELHNKLFQQWIDKTYGERIPNEKTNIDQTNATNVSRMSKTNDQNNELETKIENQHSSSHQKSKSPKQKNESVARLNKNKTYSESESPENKKMKLSFPKRSESEMNLEFLEISAVKNEINESVIGSHNEFCNQNEIISSNINDCENDEVYTKEIMEKSESLKVKKYKSSLLRSSVDEMNFEFPNNYSVTKNEMFESEIGMNILTNSSVAEKEYVETEINDQICNQNEFNSFNIIKCGNDEVDKNKKIKRSDLDFTEIESTLGKSLSFRGENSHSILENVLICPKTPENDTKNADMIERENDFALNCEMDNKYTQDLRTSPKNVKDALKKVEEISNKKFKGTLLDSLF